MGFIEEDVFATLREDGKYNVVVAYSLATNVSDTINLLEKGVELEILSSKVVNNIYDVVDIVSSISEEIEVFYVNDGEEWSQMFMDEF